MAGAEEVSLITSAAAAAVAVKAGPPEWRADTLFLRFGFAVLHMSGKWRLLIRKVTRFRLHEFQDN